MSRARTLPRPWPRAGVVPTVLPALLVLGLGLLLGLGLPVREQRAAEQALQARGPQAAADLAQALGDRLQTLRALAQALAVRASAALPPQPLAQRLAALAAALPPGSRLQLLDAGAAPAPGTAARPHGAVPTAAPPPLQLLDEGRQLVLSQALPEGRWLQLIGPADWIDRRLAGALPPGLAGWAGPDGAAAPPSGSGSARTPDPAPVPRLRLLVPPTPAPSPSLLAHTPADAAGPTRAPGAAQAPGGKAEVAAGPPPRAAPPAPAMAWPLPALPGSGSDPPLLSGGWVQAELPAGWFDARRRALQATVAAGTAGLALALLLLQALLMHRLGRPLARLMRRLQQLSQDPRHPAAEPPGPADPQELLRAVARLRRRLRATQAELDHQAGQRRADLRRLHEGLAGPGERDPLTGLLNPRGLAPRFEAALALGRRQRGALSLILLALDPAPGGPLDPRHEEALLRSFAAWLGSCFRGSDFCARVGPQEFAIVVTENGTHRSLWLAQRLVEKAARLGLPGGGPLSLSAGVAGTDASGFDLHALYVDAGEALRSARAAGGQQSAAAPLRHPLGTPAGAEEDSRFTLPDTLPFLPGSDGPPGAPENQAV